ncbi:MAG: condensation domain-containing protein, partial [Ruminococcus sp.]|nr:condensation domain-containing protein [Ruminococcus sp.]
MDEIIQKLNESFCTILKIDECGNDENFLELGGGSFEFTKLQMQIKKSLGKKISLKELYRCGTVNGIAALIGGGQSDDEVVHVTDMQKTVYIGRRKEVTLGGSASKAYFELACDDYDTDRFRDTVTKIVNSQVSLRAAYVDEGRCIIRSQVSVEVPEYDLRGLSDDERAARLGENRTKQYEHEFDPAAPPLIAFSVSRTTDTSAIIHVSYDGLVSDGEGLDILIHEIDAVYGGKEPSVPCRFADYCSYLSDVKSSEDFEDDRRFWAEMVKNISHRPRLPIMKRPEKVEKASAVQIVKYFDESEYAAVSELARKNNITPFALLLTVFGKVLSLYSENHSFFINIPMSVRPEECRNIENTVGLCSNFTFVHFDDTKDLPLIETAAATQETLFDCREHSSFSGTDILKLFQERIGASIPAPVTFTSTVGSSRHGELAHFSKHYVRTFTSQNWIEVLLTEMDGSKVFLMNYEPDIISARTAEGIADCFMETVSRIASDESCAVTLRDIGVCSRDMSIIAETALLYDKDAENAEEKMWIGAELINAFKSYPDRKAIVSEEGEYTYGELRAAAESFISVLVSRCGHKPARIALVMDKTPEQIIVSAACMCAGISYMPLETELPEETQIKCIDNVNAEAVVVLGEHLAGIDSDRYNVIRCDSSVFT